MCLLICESIRALNTIMKYPWFSKGLAILSKIMASKLTLPWAYKNQLHIDLATNFAWLPYRTAVRVLPVFHLKICKKACHCRYSYCSCMNLTLYEKKKKKWSITSNKIFNIRQCFLNSIKYYD